MGALTWIVVLPLAGFLVNGLAGNAAGKRFVSVVGCGLPIVSFLIAVGAVMALLADGSAPRIETAFTWAVIGGKPFEIGFYLDRLSAVMVLIVTGVSFLPFAYVRF